MYFWSYGCEKAEGLENGKQLDSEIDHKIGMVNLEAEIGEDKLYEAVLGVEVSQGRWKV